MICKLDLHPYLPGPRLLLLRHCAAVGVPPQGMMVCPGRSRNANCQLVTPSTCRAQLVWREKIDHDVSHGAGKGKSCTKPLPTVARSWHCLHCTAWFLLKQSLEMRSFSNSRGRFHSHSSALKSCWLHSSQPCQARCGACEQRLHSRTGQES